MRDAVAVDHVGRTVIRVSPALGRLEQLDASAREAASDHRSGSGPTTLRTDRTSVNDRTGVDEPRGVRCRCCAATSSGAGSPRADEGAPLLDAVTGEEVARVSSAGHRHGRRAGPRPQVGGPALRELTFHQRAALLKALGVACCASTATSCTRCPPAPAPRWATAKFDVDGGIGVLLGYASKAKRELPNDTVYVDGRRRAARPGRHSSLGQHILTPLRGVAVQINAFNFPVWGPLEKLAPAFLAGVPSLIKPASQTAYLTARLVELIVESGLLPDGRAAAGLRQRRRPARPPDRAGPGRRSPARPRPRGSCAPTRRRGRGSVRFNAEADSLNCSILGPGRRAGHRPSSTCTSSSSSPR